MESNFCFVIEVEWGYDIMFVFLFDELVFYDIRLVSFVFFLVKVKCELKFIFIYLCS